MLLGYTIFVGIAGQYLPFNRPKIAKKRPLWFLGLWVGTTVAVLVAVGLHLAYHMKPNEPTVLVTPGIIILSAALLPGMIIFFWYRWRVKRQTLHSPGSESLNSTENEDAKQLDNTLASNAQISITQITDELDATLPLDSIDRVSVGERENNVTEQADHPGLSDRKLDETLLFNEETTKYNEPLLVNVGAQTEPETLAESDSEVSAETDSGTVISIDSESATAIDTETKPEAYFESTCKIEAEAIPEIESVVEVDSALIDYEPKPNSILNDVDTEHELPALVDSKVFAQQTAELTASKQEIIRLRDELETESHTRKELETHLRITRKGLGVLESESREFESHKAAALIKIERELEEKIKRASAAEALADREMSKRVDLENEILLLREDTLKATTDCRVSTEARASALNTANKAATIARQAIQIRAQLESQLRDVKADLDNKQATISSLIKALEKEKSRTQEDVSQMAKQLRLHEKQLQARRTLEEVSRTVDNKLSTRLVKKVAKSRN